ncbi:hypothetical protein [Acinetobacter lwoffii]|uniref:hypothetical protein n=1 Tax=Acinetobacter lwoffii TaxID=28090 RepID=UPI003F9065AA
MSFGIKKQQPKQGGKIKGPGTGTSDDVQKTVPNGTYIMPADSTAQIGEQNLEQLGQGKPLDINVSNGEFQMTPEQVHAVGAQALDQMKEQTHTPSGLPQTIMDQPGEKPQLFFRDGGLVQNRYPSADEVRKAQQARLGGSQMRDVTPEQRQLPATRSSQPQASTPSTAAPASSGGGFGIKATNMAKGLGKFHVAGAGLGGAAAGLNTSTEDYATRLGLDRNADRGPLAEAAIRTTGVLTDVGNAASFGLLGSRFADKQINQARADADANMADIAKRRAERDATRAKAVPQQQAAVTPAPSFNDQMNEAMYGSPPGSQAQPGTANPYAIQQNGNSFSYANPGAAAQARASGVPETQASGIRRQARDPEGVAKFMDNTREMGPSEQQIQAAIGQQMNPQGFGLRYPDRPQMTDEQANERRQLVRDISAPIKGARGMTANQRGQLLELNQGDQNRAVQMYNTDANNMTSVQNNSTNNAASILQTGMREDGQNMRHGASLAQDGEQFNANFGLKAREQNLTEKKEGFGIRQAERVEKLHEMYDKAQTDEQRQSIQQRINRLTGAKDQNGRDRYMAVGGGQEWDENTRSMINRPQQIFDTQSRQYVDLGNPQQGQGQSTQQFENYQVVQDANGNRAYVVNGEYVPIP